ncbi:hypothetical protein AB0L75_39610 [Streptomyces sp. NPDC052101]|uniref:hypothetical protein n=1 Tax=Streptomyces sp. NPDC052101 TaxID=3155763 RepID=UPI003440866D
MNAFEEYLADWELGDAWRPVVERQPSGSPPGLPQPRNQLWHEGVLVWAWTGADAAVCLGGQFDSAGLRCGALNPHSPGDHLGTWYVVARHGRALGILVDKFLGWIARENPAPPTPAAPHGQRLPRVGYVNFETSSRQPHR